jgi:hypothetical protein
MNNTASIVVGSRAIQLMVAGTKKILSYQGANSGATDAQYALLAAGSAGTNGVVNGVVATGGREITVTNVDAAGNASGTLYAGPFGNWSKPANTGPGAFDITINAPIDEVGNNLLTATAITALPLTIAGPDVARLITLTGNSSSSSVINLAGLDIEGNSLSKNVTLSGTSVIPTVNAFGPYPITVSLVTAHTGDTVAIGVSDTLGLPVRLDNRGAVAKGACTFGGTVEATEPTISVDPSVISKNLITLNSDLDGSKSVTLVGVRCDYQLAQILP